VPPGPVRGHRGSRVRRGILIGVFAAVLAVILGITAVLVTSSAPPAPKSDCPKPPCGKPPEPPKGDLAPALVAGKLFKSGAGFQLEFDPTLWAVTDRTDAAVELQVKSTRVIVLVQLRAQPADEVTPDDAVSARLDSLGRDILGLAEDTRPSQLVLDPAVGYRSGVGEALSGVTDTPQGPGSPVSVVVMAATDGQITVTMTLITDESVRKPAFTITDSMMNTFRFPTEVPT
jgi:hypothetical protein